MAGAFLICSQPSLTLTSVTISLPSQNDLSLCYWGDLVPPTAQFPPHSPRSPAPPPPPGGRYLSTPQVLRLLLAVQPELAVQVLKSMINGLTWKKVMMCIRMDLNRCVVLKIGT